MSGAADGNVAYFSLGSNVEAEMNLPAAVRLLGRLGAVVGVSPVYQSAAFGNPNQPDYLNAVVCLATDLGPDELCTVAVPAIESALGRERGPDKFGPRTIDIDLLLFNDESLAIGHRRIPSPEIAERAYVAVPMAQLAPDLIHPELGLTMSELAARLELDTLKTAELTLNGDSP